MAKEKLRSEISDEYKWDLTKFIKDEKELDKKLEQLDKAFKKLLSYKGKIMESPETLYNLYIDQIKYSNLESDVCVSPESRRSPADGGCPALSTRLSLSQPRKSSPGQSLQTLPVSLHLGNAQCSRSPPAYCPLLPSQLPAWSSGCSETPGEGSLWIFQFLPAASGNAADQGQPLW